MEAIAHSPSFAKKAGVSQSVGKDYAAADKGKTFGKGGEMKESKGMVGKEVAFMKKKGAPKSMIKHEMAEMKRGGKVRRMAEGGETDMSMGYGDPFAKPRDYDKEKAQGAENLKRIKGFFGFGDKEEKEAPVPRPSLDPSLLKFNKEETAAAPAASTNEVKPSRVSTANFPASKPNVASEMEEREKGGERGSANKGPDYGDDSSSSSQIFKREPKRRAVTASSPTSKPVTVSKSKETTKVTTAPSEGKKTESGPNFDEASGTQRRYGRSSKIGVASDETRESIRRGLGRFADIFNLSKRHEQEFGKKYAKGGKVKKMAYGGSADDGMAMGQPMRGAAPMKPAMQPPRVPLLNPNRPGISDLAKQKMGAYNQGMLGRIAASKKMAEGGVARADGIAKKGKTEGKMVKMAAGGFVKSADGCAQRGKTKGAQVKMNRGGMC
jgi:hypothetical protein